MNPLSVLLLVATLSYGVTADYCSPKLCGSAKHVACGNNGAFSSTCPKDATMVTITSDLKNLIVNAHNEKRNIVASGAGANHDAACRMASMQWDDELADLAAYNVKQCEMNHDECHNTNAFQHSGQNLAWMSYYGPVDHQARLTAAVDMWYNEIKNSRMQYINSYPKDYRGPTIGHFTVMVADKNTRVGCAASTYTPEGETYTVYLMACNYATTNMIDYRIYASCTTAASGCTTGTNPAYPALCSSSEPIDANDLS